MIVLSLLAALLGGIAIRLTPRWTGTQPAPWEYGLGAVAGAGLAWFLPEGAWGWHGLLLLGTLICASAVDLRCRIIPNEVVLFGLVSGGLLALLYPRPGMPVYLAFLGAVLGFGLMLLLAIVARGGMGEGDVKLTAVLGLFTAGYASPVWWVGPVMTLLLSFLLAAAVSLLLLALRVVGRKDFIPFGPFLAGGALATVLWGDRVLQWYLG